MTISKLTYEMRMDVVETPDVSVSTYPDPAVTHLIQTAQKLTGATDLFLTTSTTPGIDTVGGTTLTLSGGTIDLDLTAFDQGNLPDIDFTGKLIYMFKITADVANTDRIRVFPASSNGYELFGSAAGEISLGPGEVCMFYNPGGLDAVGASDLGITFSSPDVDAKATILVAAGT